MIEERNIEWLAKKIGDLFETASKEQEPDHSACAKYAELLAKLLFPKIGKVDSGEGLEQARKAAMAAIKESNRKTKEADE